MFQARYYSAEYRRKRPCPKGCGESFSRIGLSPHLARCTGSKVLKDALVTVGGVGYQSVVDLHGVRRFRKNRTTAHKARQE